MKRKLALILCVLTAICYTVGLTACGGGEQSGGTGSGTGGIEQSGSTDGGSDSGSDGTEQHSQIYYDVFNRAYYNNLIEENKTSTGALLAKRACAPIPFGFLEQAGYHINLIKDGEVECESAAYMKDDEANKLYVTVRIENTAGTKYYTCYVLTYPISSLESSDLTYLARNSLIQSSFFIQELSYQKTPTIESSASITVNAYNGIIRQFEDAYNDSVTMDFTHFSIEDNTLECTMRPSYVSSVLTENVLIRYAKLKPGTEGVTIGTILNHSVYVYPDYYVTYQNDEAKALYKENPTGVTYFEIQSKILYSWLKLSGNI